MNSKTKASYLNASKHVSRPLTETVTVALTGFGSLEAAQAAVSKAAPESTKWYLDARWTDMSETVVLMDLATEWLEALSDTLCDCGVVI